MENETNKEIEELIKKVSKGSKGKLDLSSDEDLSIAVMNLISIEEHLAFTGVKTEKDHYYDLLKKVREIRKDLLKKIIKEYEGEVWCISKHLLASSMRSMEVGTKQLGMGNKKEAEEMFKIAYELYALFWGINLKIEKKEKLDKSLSDESGSKKKLSKLAELVKKLVSCCRE